MKITTSIQILRGFAPAVAAGATILAGCAAGPNANPADPIESLNREVFHINEDLGKGVLKPIVQTYVDVVPSPAHTTVSNFFSNTSDVYPAVGSLLQLKGTTALEDTMRVTINTVLSLSGLIDVASDTDLPKHKEDFGQTLGTWGVLSNPYIVQPLLGPSTARGTVGSLVDRQVGPLTYWRDSATTHSLAVLRVVDVRTDLLGASSVFGRAVIDEYTFLRGACLQHRRYLVYDDNLPEDQGNTKSPDTGDATASSYYHFAPNWPVFRH